jgi:hypothetical protein
MKSAGVGAARLWRLQLNVYLDAAQTPLKVPNHFSVLGVNMHIGTTPKYNSGRKSRL